jgi:hypothetical protein
MRRALFTALAVTTLVAGVAAPPAAGFSVPQLFWPQHDIDSAQAGSPLAPCSILIASRASDYKRALVGAICDSLAGDSMYVKVVGLRQLAGRDVSAYRAIVLVNTCMGWSLDSRMGAFLRRHKGLQSVLVLTTSATGEWLPRERRRWYDALASASEQSNIPVLAGSVAVKVRALSRAAAAK